MNRMMIALLACLSFCGPAFSQIYKWKDKDGNIVVSTTPPPPGVDSDKKELDKTLPAPKANRAEGAKPQVPDSEFRRRYQDIKVIMYVTDWCPVCRKARAFLNSLRVNLIEYDVEKNEARNKERLRKSGGRKGVPLIDIEGVILRGFDSVDIRAAIEQKRIY